MALFSRKKGAAVEVDDLLRDPAAHAAAAAARGGDAAGCAAALAGTTGEARSLVLRALANNLPLGAARGWSESNRDTADAWLVRGVAEFHAAREARGSGMAETVGRDQALDFMDLMADAGRSLRRAAELAPDDPEPWAWLIGTSYAAGVEHLDEWVGELRRRAPFHLAGLTAAVNLLGRKWYGEPGQARALADGLAAEAHEGDHIRVLVADAVVEEWLYLGIFEKKGDEATAFVRSPETRQALLRAVAGSLDSPAYRPSPFTPEVRNHFAFALNLAREREAAARQFTALDGLATDMPWGYLGESGKAFERARRAAG